MTISRESQTCNDYHLFYDVVNQLHRVHAKAPELRLCQILYIAASKCGWSDNDLFYCPDEYIYSGLRKM